MAGLLSRRRLGIGGALTLVLAGCAFPAAADARRNVLLVFDEDRDLPGLALINRGLREGFQER